MRRAYKICSANPPGQPIRPCLVTLEVPDSAHCIATDYAPNGDVTTFRCNWAKVIGIAELAIEDGVVSVLDDSVSVAYNCYFNPNEKTVRYEVGKRLWVRNFDEREYVIGGNGIHCFATQIDAVNYYRGALLPSIQ